MFYPSVHLEIAKLFVITGLVPVKDHKGEDYTRPELLGCLVAEDEHGNVFLCEDKNMAEATAHMADEGYLPKAYENGMAHWYRDMWSHQILPKDRDTKAPYFWAIMAAEKKEIPFRPWNGLTLDEEEKLSEEEYEAMCSKTIGAYGG